MDVTRALSRFMLLGGLLALAGTGCTATDRPEPECQTAADCQDGLLCADGRCVEPTACTDDADCAPPTPRCEPQQGRCVVCLADGDCPAGQVCRQAGCQQPAACQGDDDCSAGEICVGDDCLSGCRSSRDCPAGQTCLPDEGPHGTCAQCQDDGDCPVGYRCLDYRCDFFCTADEQCAPRVCDPDSGRCLECTADAHCAPGSVCQAGACVAGCRADDGCPAERPRCDPDGGTCVECLSLNDCPLGHVCAELQCVPGCTTDRDCPTDLYCDPAAGDHGGCFTCAADEDCPPSETCVDHACAFRCSSDADCDPPRPVCDPDTAACVVCLAKDDCELGELCIERACVPGCESSRDCPDGQQCQSGQCQAACQPSGQEVCDGIDNDCDGRTDGGDPQLVLAPCERSAGACAGAHHLASQCVDAAWQPCEAAQYGPDFGPEVCDGLDSDCDGLGDEGLQLDCAADYVCLAGECAYSGGCTSECAEGSTECSFWDSSIVLVCRNVDTDPCLEWDEEACPPNSYCDDFIFNECICEYESCADLCCPAGAVCHQGACCQPDCPARTCGSDGCGGSCQCDLPNDQCLGGVCSCTPSCAGKECGPDGCGGACPDTCPAGTHCQDNRCACDFAECLGSCCAEGQVCSTSTGLCCDPQCSGLACGPDGCGHTCGSCQDNEACLDGQCVCQPDCLGRQCGSDGCGGSCGSCPLGQSCDQGTCCTPQCAGRQCGPDGCGGSCGSCGSNQECNASGGCVCAEAECNGTCCASGQSCYQGQCCTPSCGDGWSMAYHCDDDGCGGTCDCSQTYGPPAVCQADLSCACPPPAYDCLSLLYGLQCCPSSSTCNELLGCF